MERLNISETLLVPCVSKFTNVACLDVLACFVLWASMRLHILVTSCRIGSRDMHGKPSGGATVLCTSKNHSVRRVTLDAALSRVPCIFMARLLDAKTSFGKVQRGAMCPGRGEGVVPIAI